MEFLPKGGITTSRQDVLKVVQEAAEPIEENTRAGDSVALIGIQRAMRVLTLWDTSQPMDRWTGVTLWNERHEGYKEGYKGRVKRVQFTMYNINEKLPYEFKYLTAAEEKKAKTRTLVALILGFLIGVECGFMGSAGGALMLMVLTMVMGMDTKLAVGTSSMVMTLVALTGAVSHVAMGAKMELLPAIVITVTCTIAAVLSSKFANKVEEKTLNRVVGVVLIVVSVHSLILSK